MLANINIITWARTALLVAGALTAHAGTAEVNGFQWSVSPILGLHDPSLNDFNEGEFRSPYDGRADILDSEGNNVPTRFTYRLPVPEFTPGALAGAEFQWLINERHSFLIGIGSWEAVSQASAYGRFPVQGYFEDVIGTRKVKLSYNEYYLGWRYNFLRKAKKYLFYTQFSGHEGFDVDHREDLTLYFLSGPVGVKKNIITFSQATGLLMLQGGVGGEYFLRDWVSLGLETSIVVGMRKMHLKNGTLYSDFISTDNLALELPIIPGPEGNMIYQSEDGSAYKEFKMNFNGWKAMFKVNFYY